MSVKKNFYKKIRKIYIKYKKFLKLINFTKIKKKKKILNKKYNKQNIFYNNKIFTQENIFKKNIYKIEKIKQEIKFLYKKIKKYKICIKKYNFKKEISIIKRKILHIKIQNFFNKKKYKNNCYINIQSGSGGTDAQDWSLMILKMYIKWAEKKNLKIKIIEKINGEIAGIKSATILIIGKYIYGYLKNETGIHRLIRQSPFKTNKKRHTSFSSVFVYPEKKNIKPTNFNINLQDIHIDVYKSSGSGGQHANRTESAVRIKHIPTGIITQCKKNRSQHKNKKQAIIQLKNKISKIKIKKQKHKKSNINWGNQTRTYIFDYNIVKDIKLKIKIKNIQKILNGNIDIFIEKNLEKKYKKKYEQ